MGLNVNIYKSNVKKTLNAEAGDNLLDLLRNNDIEISSPCGGNGKCGKCRVIIRGNVLPPKEKEKELLGREALKAGYRLSCYINILDDIDVYLDDDNEAVILSNSNENILNTKPLFEKKYVELIKPSIENQKSDIEGVVEFNDRRLIENDIGFISELPELLRESDYNVTYLLYNNLITGIEKGNTTEKIYGAAFDIGTTTIAAYLYDLKEGKRINVVSRLNPQKAYGADVISRIEYTMDNAGGLKKLNDVIIKCINEMLIELCEKNNISKNEVYISVFVGNTTMTNLLLNVPVVNIAASPFIAATTLMHLIKPEILGVDMNQYGRTLIIPSVSGYIGADIVAAVLNTKLDKRKGNYIMIDIGTNGEIVLKTDKGMYSCSTAAGPAFEGANIRNGTGGINGAIDSFHITKDGIGYTTIGNKKPVGICGSGIVDIAAGLINAGIIDETGWIADEDELNEIDEKIRKRIISENGQKAFLIEYNENTKCEGAIILTQKDIRELQNAKAAIAAGISTLVKKAGISYKDIDTMFIAGGFGNYINTDSALVIGLLPSGLKGRIKQSGNAAGAGAVDILMSKENLERILSIKKSIKYIELSADPDFVNMYVENMMF